MDRYEIATALLRGVHVAASLSLFGCLVFRGFVVPRGARELPLTAVNRITWISAVLALVCGAVWLAAVSGTIAGANSLASLLAAVPVVARHTSFGNFVCARLLLLVAVVVLLAFRAPRWAPRARIAALVIAGAALSLQPMIGHIGAADGREVLIPIEAAHLLAAGAWLGGLLPLLVCVLRGPPPLAAELCNRFTPVGLVAVGTIAVSALPQAGELIGGLPALFGTQYGHLALVKIALFCLALGLACLNRLVLTARLTAGLARRALIGSIAIEFVVVCCVVLAASAMASSTPAAHEQPVWPFAWRPSLDAWSEPELRGELVRLLVATGAGLVLIGASLIIRRFRVAAVALAALVVAPFAHSLDLLLVEAYPTSYAQSTTGFSVNAIAHGETLFTQWCAACHLSQAGTGGETDLTAPHIWGHLDGELFWWVTNGIQDPEGAALMPAFGSVLSEDDRWALVDFIHAWNVGHQTATTGHWSPPIAAPATPLVCANRDADTLADLATHILIVEVEAEPTPPDAVSASSRAEAFNSSGMITIRLPRGPAGKPRPGECVAASEEAWEAWRTLAGVMPDRFAGYRAIVDGQGWLRAWLPPDAASDQVEAAVRDARDHPIATGARPVHHH